MNRRTAAAALLSAAGSAISAAFLAGCKNAVSSSPENTSSTPKATPRTRRQFEPVFQRGMNFTAEHRAVYGSPEANQVLIRMKQRGVDSIALVPYGFQRRNEPTVRFGRGWETDDSIRDATKAAHDLGLRVMLKPQIWVGGGWPGDVNFPTDPDQAEWFDTYRAFIGHYAELAEETGADLFSAGVEFVKMTRYADQWRGLIEYAREFYGGPIVYCATQGEEFENLQFWDALDYIGLNEYYPLPDDLSTTDLVRRIESVQKKFNKPVLFTEAGFTSYSEPHKAPWDETDREISLTDQARCYEAVLKAVWDKPWFYGVYWWRVGTNGEGGPKDGRHTPWEKPAMDVVERWYRKPRK